MAFKLDLDLKLLLTDRYNPAEDSPYKFRQCYTQLVTHRDHLQKQCDAKEQRRANMKHAIRQASATASEVLGTRFSSLSNNDNGSISSPQSSHDFSASLTNSQLDNLATDEREPEVEKIKRDIQWLIENKREKRRAITVEPEEKGIWEHFNEEKDDQDEAKNENQDEPGESEFGQGWNTVKYFGKR